MTMNGTTKDKICAILAEICGTALMVFIGCLCVCNFKSSHFEVSLAFGLAIMMLTTAFVHISGAIFNPSVTIAGVVYGKFTVSVSEELKIIETFKICFHQR